MHNWKLFIPSKTGMDLVGTLLFSLLICDHW